MLLVTWPSPWPGPSHKGVHLHLPVVDRLMRPAAVNQTKTNPSKNSPSRPEGGGGSNSFEKSIPPRGGRREQLLRKIHPAQRGATGGNGGGRLLQAGKQRGATLASKIHPAQRGATGGNGGGRLFQKGWGRRGGRREETEGGFENPSCGIESGGLRKSIPLEGGLRKSIPLDGRKHRGASKIHPAQMDFGQDGFWAGWILAGWIPGWILAGWIPGWILAGWIPGWILGRMDFRSPPMFPPESIPLERWAGWGRRKDGATGTNSLENHAQGAVARIENWNTEEFLESLYTGPGVTDHRLINALLLSLYILNIYLSKFSIN